MANEVRNKDLFAGDLFLTEIEKAKLLLKTLDELEQGFKDVAKAQKQIVNKEDNATIQSVQKTKKAIKELNEVEKAALTVQKQKKALAVQLRVANSEANRQNVQNKLLIKEQIKDVTNLEKQKLKTLGVIKKTTAEINKENKASQKLRKSTLDNANAFKRLTKQTNEAQARFKRLAAQYGQTDSRTKKALVTFNKLDNKLRSINNTARDGRRDVGRYGLAFSKLGGALKSGLGFLGITAGIAGITRVLSGSIKIAKEFEQGNANLASVLGVTASEIVALTDDAKRLGAATSFSATQVSSLQTEFAKLGFNEQEILNATEATLDLAAATGADLGEAAAVAGATLGGFGLDASETGRIADVMAKSFSTSALDLEKFKEAMKGAAPAAKAVGVDVEQTTALLGTLANAGISGSKAGNNLKTSFINLNAAGLTLEEGLEKVANSEDKLGTAAKLVGKNAAASFLVLADGVDVTKELEKGLNNAGGAAKKMADEQLNTLEGKTKILNSAWEGLVLSLLSGDGAFSSISKGLVEMATNLLGVLTPAEDLATTWFAQEKSVEKLEASMNPLLDRYDDLKGKTELTKEEQIELDSVIQDIARDLPLAVTEFDKYGKAMDISSTSARKLVAQTRRILEIKNAPAIKEEEEAILALARSTEKARRGLERIGDEWVRSTIVINQNGTARKAQEKITAEELTRIQDLTVANNLDIEAREGIIARLKGQKSAAEIAAEAEEALNASLGKNVTTLNSLNAELSELKKLRGDIDVTDKQSLKNNKELIKAKQKEIDLIEGKIAKDKKDKKEGKSNQDDELKRYNDFLTEKEKLENEYNDKQLTDKENELNSVEDKYFKLIEEAKEYGEDTAVLEDARLAEIEAINSKYRKKAAKTQEDADKKSDNERQKLADKEKKDREEQQKELREAIKRSIDAIAGFVDEGFTKQIQGIDKELDKTGDNIENLTEKANQGQLAAADSLAFEQKQEAELERDREETRKKQERTKAFFAVLDSFNANDGNVGKTISDIAVLKALASGFTAFDGVDDTGSRGNLDSKGGKAWILHPNEQVYSKKDREDLGFRSREEVKDIVKMYDNGTLSELMAHDISNDFISPTSFKLNGLGNNADVVNKLNQLNQSIKGIDIPEGMINIDEVRGLINLVSRKGNKKTTERSKLH